MADLVLSPVAEKILRALVSAAVQEIAQIWGVNEDLEELENTISLIKDVLVDAEEKQVRDRGIKNWLKRLADSVREADDLMDEFETEALRMQLMPGNEVAKQVCTFFSASNPLAFRRKIGRRIREIKKKLAAASNDKVFLLLEVRSTDQESRVVRRRETHSFVPRDEVIGRDGDIEALRKLLLEGEFEENVAVIPIVGMGGLGKTTLAQSVYNDEKVQQHFELKAWVCVSDNFDSKSIIQAILKSKDVNIEGLQQDLRKMLGGKRYLLVLDDVWEEKHGNWLTLENLLIGGARGSRVIVTTRSKVVAGITSKIKPYELGVLEKEESWSLFKKMAFREGEEDKNSNLVGIGMEIVERCGGVPLAIRTIGSMLYFKNSETEWSSLNKEFSKISQEGDDILPKLRLSYNNLAPYLKHCFAYCRLFPKDYTINVQTLVQLLMAQGLVRISDPSHDQCLEDVGYGYFMNLLERSFFQEIELDESGVVERCKMHDLIHDLAIDVAGEEYSTVSPSYQGNINKRTRHVSFEFQISSARDIPSSLLRASKIQTVLLLDQSIFHSEQKAIMRICDAIISNFKQLRTINLYNSGITIVPDSISSLKYVRYLDLSQNSGIKTLPKSLTNMLNLQTLKLSCCVELQELPADIVKLVNLRHLEIGLCYKLTHMPDGLGQLSNLQILSMFVLPESSGSTPRHSGELKELHGLNNLRGKLEILNLGHGKDAAVESESANLKAKQYLRSLELRWIPDVGHIDATEANIVGYEMSLEGLQPHPNLRNLCLRFFGGIKFSSWLPSLNLISLTLSSCTKCTYLFPLSQFQSLKKLTLEYLSSLEYITSSNYETKKALLPSLEELTLSSLPKLKGWWREFVVSGEQNHNIMLPSFPRLSDLTVWDCTELTCMPLFPYLEGLHLSNTSLNLCQQTILESIPTTSSFSPLSNLKTLRIRHNKDLQFLPDWWKSLTSLSDLDIRSCSQLEDLCPGIQYLTSLRRLWIQNCDELVETLLDDDTYMWKALSSVGLQDLTLCDFPEMEALPEGIQLLTSLEHLCFWNCESLTTIPEWIGNLRSLRSLTFLDCTNLASLPEGIQNLASLQTLSLSDCPMLLERCQRPLGEDWPKIAHIPNLELDSYQDEDNDSDIIEEQNKSKLFNMCGLR